ncbi:MAG: site-specific DNA-methyltransferase [Candidatus Poribacteria bacterium]|nr:site-specific DNA-methyltransferase [Candidatus Poribacteria bacterium]
MLESNPTTDALNTLREKLRDMFHFAHNDLDFGIFRILKIKHDEVNQFIDEKLPSIVDESLVEVAKTLHNSQLAEVKEYVKKEGGATEQGYLNDVPGNLQLLIDFLEYKRQDELIAPLQINPEDLKSKLAFSVYNHVHSFFEGYYRDGDFGYNDRSTAHYKVNYPDESDYNGADTLFHWKCRDSYYVKTATGFNSVAFEVEGKRIEYRLEGKANSSIAQNNNRDDFKHYRFDRIEPPKPDDTEPTWRVILHLAETSTPKVEIYREMSAQIFSETDDVDLYLHESINKGAELGKPIFKGLANTYDKVNDGRLQGIKALHINLESYADKLASHLDFNDLGKNKTERQAALEKRPTVLRFHTFDKNLNTFFVGMDSDYFIHKDLDRFLKTEQRRYIQNIILGDLDTLLNPSPENPAFAIATAFCNVTDAVIALLVAVEMFQKQLFLMKKKVITTDYLISVGKISEATKDDPVQREILVKQILENEAQLNDWRETFGIDVTEQLPLLEGLYPTLPLDTQYFEEGFVDKLLSLFENLEAQIDGVLLNSENFQALNLLEEKYRSRLNCVYIDPPYNTQGSPILYKNDYKHSSWLSLMCDRLLLSKKFLPNEGIICVAIDDVEISPLRFLLGDIFQKELGIAVVRSNPQGRARKGYLSPAHEYALFFGKSGASPGSLPKTEKQKNSYPHQDAQGRFTWDNLIRRPPGDNRVDVPTMFYPIYVKHDNTIRIPDMTWDESTRSYNILEKPDENEVPVWPIKAGVEKRWRHGCEKVSRERDEYRVRRAENIRVEYKSRMQEDAVPKTWWSEGTYAAARYGTTALEEILGNGNFNFPKSVYLVSDCLLTSGLISNGMVLDYFAGSGTTGHAVLNLNKTDNGDRKFILVEMGDYFDSTLKERIRRVMFSENWKDGKPNESKKIDGTVGIVKYQKLEQYEDVLNNLITLPPNDNTETEVPVKYLYRPEEQQIRLIIDLRFPFSNRITYGKDSTEGTVDLLETYCYLKGLPIHRRLRFDFVDQVYRVVQSGKRLVAFRSVTEEDDTPRLLEILEDPRLEDITQLDVNYDANQQALLDNSDLQQVNLITTSDFDTGSVWDTVDG